MKPSAIWITIFVSASIVGCSKGSGNSTDPAQQEITSGVGCCATNPFYTVTLNSVTSAEGDVTATVQGPGEVDIGNMSGTFIVTWDIDLSRSCFELAQDQVGDHGSLVITGRMTISGYQIEFNEIENCAVSTSTRANWDPPGATP